MSKKKQTTSKNTQDIKYRFGRALRRRRRELDISQEQLAELANLHRTYVSAVERGVQNVTLERIESLANALDIKISALFADYGAEVDPTQNQEEQ